MSSIPVGLAAMKNRLSHPTPYIWLIEVRVPSDPPTMIRITPNQREVAFGQTEAGEPIVYKPFPVEIGTLESDSEGGTPEFAITVGGVTREIMALLLAYDYLTDQPCRLMLVHSDHLDDANQRAEFLFEISNVSGDEQACTFTLSTDNLYAWMIPSERITRDFCGFTYKSIQCGFFGDPSNTLGACPRNYAGCSVRGEWEVANGYEQTHPGRFGGAPALTE